jgi:uncharacterized membrane protein YeaQ/YmgE (transglycosylase-associated protein family)
VPHSRFAEVAGQDACGLLPGPRLGKEKVMFWLIWVIIVGLIAGWATGKIMKGSGYGPLMDIVLGILGGVVGAWIMRMVGFYTSGGLIPSILVAILGAVVLVSLVRMLKRA